MKKFKFSISFECSGLNVEHATARMSQALLSRQKINARELFKSHMSMTEKMFRTNDLNELIVNFKF
jgi:hypothetical protein